MDFQIVTFDPTTGIATLGMPTVPKTVRGIEKLVQVVVIEILKAGGQDVINPTDGSGIRSMIGQYGFSNPQEIRVELTKRVQLAQANILSNQQGSTAPSIEKLTKLTILSIVVDSNTYNTLLKLRIDNEAGQSTEVII